MSQNSNNNQISEKEIIIYCLECGFFDDKTRRFLLSYLVNKYYRDNVYDPESCEVTLEVLKDDISSLMTELLASDKTSLTKDRIRKVEYLLSSLEEKEDILYICFELAKLCFEVEISPRNIDVVGKYLTKYLERGKNNE